MRKDRWKLGICALEDKGCVSKSAKVTDVTQSLGEVKQVVSVCHHCFELLGEELPNDKRIKEKLEQHNTPYLKNTKEKESEKIGGVRI